MIVRAKRYSQWPLVGAVGLGLTVAVCGCDVDRSEHTVQAKPPELKKSVVEESHHGSGAAPVSMANNRIEDAVDISRAEALGLDLGVWDGNSAIPGWAESVLHEPSNNWTEWKNTLAPQGERMPISLIREGRVDYRIVIPEYPSRMDNRAASELQLWLSKVTGMTLPIISDATEPQPREINVGLTNRLTESDVTFVESLGVGGYAIMLYGERILMLGRDNPMNAVIAFLEEDIGVRWYTPHGSIRSDWHEREEMLNAVPWGDDGVTRIPSIKSGEVSVVPRSYTPPVEIRTLMWGYAFRPWGLRNRINGGAVDSLSQYSTPYHQHGVASGYLAHTFHKLVPPAQYFETHPEYYSLVGDERRWKRAQLCLSNPEVAEVAASNATRVLQGLAPTQRVINVSPMDWGNDCECEDCQAIIEETGSYSGLLLTFVNRIAQKVGQKVPDAKIETLAYWQSRQPPLGMPPLEPNVQVRLCLGRGSQFDWPYHSYYDPMFASADASSQWTDVSEIELFEEWRELSPHLAIWMYPSQYANSYAPMPSIRALAENIEFAATQGVEDIFVQHGTADVPRQPMREWVIAKLLWDPSLDAENLMLDFIYGGYYGDAASEVARYNELMWAHCAAYTDFSRRRDWIYTVYDEAMFSHDFLAEAREMLNRGISLAKTDEVRDRVKALLLGVVYVEAAQLYMEMRDGAVPPDEDRYERVCRELEVLCGELNVQTLNFYDGSTRVREASKFIEMMRVERMLRLSDGAISPDAWGEWTFSWESGTEDNAAPVKLPLAEADDAWGSVSVPAFLSETAAGNKIGYGTYQTSISLDDEQAHQGIELRFGGVDEQAWVYINGEYVGEHTLESEFEVGEEITTDTLWDRPFSIQVDPQFLHAGSNRIQVRIHNSAYNSGIHKPVRAYPLLSTTPDDNWHYFEDFSDARVGDVPAGWRRLVQSDGTREYGTAEVARNELGSTLRISDQRSNVVVWSERDDVIPAGEHWTIQFDFRISGQLIFNGADNAEFSAANSGALLGLKKGKPGAGEFVPLLQLDNAEVPGGEVALRGMGEVIDPSLEPHKWYRVTIKRSATKWEFYLNDALIVTKQENIPDLSGFAFGSFVDWKHRMEDVEIRNFGIIKQPRI